MLDSIKDVVIIGDGESSELMKKYAKKIVDIQPARTKDVQRYIGLISKLPGFTTQYTMRESDLLEANPNANPIELVLITSKMKATSHARIDNFGVKATGRYHGSLFTELYSPFNKSELLMLSLSGTDKLDRTSHISAGYEQPINAEGTHLNFLGSYSKSNPTKGLPVKAKDNISSVWGISVGHYAMMQTKSHLKVNLSSDYQDTVGYNVPDEFTSGKANDTKLYTGNFSIDYLLEDKLDGRNLFEISYSKGLGGKTKYYTTPKNKISQHFNLVTVDYFRDQQLANNFSYFAHLSAQTSDDYLPDAENFVIGNRNFARAYVDTGLASRKGLGFSLEVRYVYKTNNMILTEVEPYAYYDIAKIYNKQEKTNISTLSSAGPGLRFKFSNDYMAGAEVAFPFKKKFIVGGEDRKGSTRFTFFTSKTFRF
jgi:hemolysin activation/secretion protein